MAFLTKKEQAVIKAINSNTGLTAKERSKMVHDINYNARLRQDGYRVPVREFIQAMANYNVELTLNSVKK